MRFRHELARRAYRESLPATRRLELNRAVMRYLEGTRRPDPARLVHHAEAAQDREALTRHGLAAAQRPWWRRAPTARPRLSYERALRYAEQTLSPEDRAAALRGPLRRGIRGRPRQDLALDSVSSALALRRDLGDVTAIGTDLRWLSRVHWWRGRRKEAEDAAAAAVAIPPLEPRRPVERARHGPQQPLPTPHAGAAVARGDRNWRARHRTPARRHRERSCTRRPTWEPSGCTSRTPMRAGRFSVWAPAGGADLDEEACRAFHNMASVDHDHRRLDLAARRDGAGARLRPPGRAPWFEADTLILRALIELARGRWSGGGGHDRVGARGTTCPAVGGAGHLVLAAVELRRGGPRAHELVEAAWQLAHPTDDSSGFARPPR